MAGSQPLSTKRSPTSSNSFFFQAEDGIRDIGVTGVQTCALPISHFRFNNAVLEQYGAAAVIAAAARQPGGQVGMHNNPSFLWQAEYAAHAFSRSQIGRASCRERV